MCEHISVYDFITGNVYHKIVNDIECWELYEKERDISKIECEEKKIVLCKSGSRYYIKSGKNLFFSLKGFMDGDFKYNGKTFEDVTGLSEKLKYKFIEIEVSAGNESELTQIINSENKIRDNILYEKMLSVDDCAKGSGMMWCVWKTVFRDTGGFEVKIAKEFDSKEDAWEYAKNNEESVRSDDNIVVYKIGLVKKIMGKYEVKSNGNIKIHEPIIKVMREK